MPRIGAGVLTIAGLTVAASIVLSTVTTPWVMVAVLGTAVLLLPSLNASSSRCGEARRRQHIPLL